MGELLLVGSVLFLIIAVLVLRRRPRLSWPDKLRRLHAGVARHAEWMAPDEVVRTVEQDYHDTQAWMAKAVLGGYVSFIKEAPIYFSGNYLKRQERAAAIYLETAGRGPRFTGRLETKSAIRVRCFASDGLSCILIDHQTERRMFTYEYWDKLLLLTQKLEGGALVYRMVYDPMAGRWKIDEFIQQLPLGWENKAMSDAPFPLDETLPVSFGRDL